jgi:hypothetical protein
LEALLDERVLPEPVASSSTDADGVFKVTFTGKGKYCIAALAERAVLEW